MYNKRMELFMVFLIWLFLCHLIGKVGESRNIGYGSAFLLSFIFSPLIGLIITAVSGKKDVMGIDQFKAHFEKAKIEEDRCNIYEAIEEYKKALYYLRVDNKTLSPNQEFLNEEKLNEVKARIETLGGSWRD